MVPFMKPENLYYLLEKMCTKRAQKLYHSVYVIKTNLMRYLSSVYFVNQCLHVSGILVVHRQKVYCIYIYIYICIYNNWYALCFLVDFSWPVHQNLKCTLVLARHFLEHIGDCVLHGF